MASKLLDRFPQPLLDDLLAGRWLPVIGAGMSLNAVMPRGKKLPLWGDLGRALEKELKDFSPTSVLDCISAYEHEFGRVRLIEKLSQLLLVQDSHPGLAHREFCSIRFDIVCTTNFDYLLERQYEQIPHFVHPVIDEEQLSINLADPGTLLLKLHGDLRHPNRLIVSEADYDGFLARFPLLATYLSNLLITRTAVFIGYSLDDPDFRQILHVVDERLGRSRRMRYALVLNATAADIKRFERRHVQAINIPSPKDKYGETLATVFRELREYTRDKIISVSKVKEEQPLRELSLPRDVTTSLCFCAVPLEQLPFYRERIFPVIEESGFVTVTADDVVSPGENISAKIDALIDRSAIVIVELGSSWTKSELQIALARLKTSQAGTRPRSFHVVVVTHPGEEFAPEISGCTVLQRDNTKSGFEAFVSRISTVLRGLAPMNIDSMAGEPIRLLRLKEYRAALISAMTLLEAGLRVRLNKQEPAPEERRLSLRLLMDRAHYAEIFDNNVREKINKWISWRNSAVHTAMHVNRAQAEEVVNGVAAILRQ